MTDYPGWEDHNDITVYQMGWRLGGKTATGRGVHNRIVEKGIHISQGWYDNAFRMVKDAYKLQEELDPEQAKKLKDDDVDLEISWSKWENYREFKLEEGNDFDSYRRHYRSRK
ncbi:MAG: NAD(P)-binding protein [Balneolaceae bacterium]|jgi:uncharacterized protein with NAD-binding domain and iron-sulfur cluster|nr:NAD(P)-binding protein [Balneolaceae bacterium]